jgi:hypothetical protein
MATREIIPFVLAAIGGFGGLVSALIHMSMVDALNTQRPIDDRIPNPRVTWDDCKWIWKNPGFGYWGVRRKYREQFPAGKLLFWETVSIAWMHIFEACAVLLFVLH